MTETHSHDTSLEVQFDYGHMIRMVDLTNALAGLSELYRSQQTGDNDSNLYVSKVAEGSIIFELVSSAIAIMSDWNDIVQFGQWVGMMLNRFRGRPAATPVISKPILRSLVDLMSVTASDPSGSMELRYKAGGKVTTITSLNHDEAVEVRENARRALQATAPEDELYNQIPVKLVQARTNNQKKGHQGTIEWLDSRPKPIHYNRKEDLESVATGERNPLNSILIADVLVRRVEGKPVVYIINQLHDIISPEELDFMDDDALTE